MESKGPAFFPLFVARLNDSGTTLVWSTFLGGIDWQETDGVWSLNLGATGDVYLSGSTDTETFPTTPGAYQTTFEPGALGTTFITRFTPDAKSLVYSTFYGGSWTGGVKPIVVDPSGVITGVGTAVSDRFVHTPGGCVARTPLALVLGETTSRIDGVLRTDALCEREVDTMQLERRDGFLRIVHELTLDVYAAFGWQPAHTLVERDPAGGYYVNLSKFPEATLRSWLEKKGLL